MIESFSFSSEVIQNWLMFINIIAIGIITIYLHIKNEKTSREQAILNKLENIQKISVSFPYLEDKKYTENWKMNRSLYLSEELSDKDKEMFLRYNAYTELIFNLTEICVSFYKTEENLLNKIDFKSWIRVHKSCWSELLEEYSNRDVYSEAMNKMIDKWIN